MHEPRTGHVEAMKRILRYLKGTIGDRLVYQRTWSSKRGHEILTYTDADWANDPDERRSVSGYCIFIGNNLVSWSSKKQKTMAAGTAEATWVRHLLQDLGEVITSSLLLCDNQSAINISFNPIHHSRTKHIEIDQHFIRQKVEDKEIVSQHIRTENQVADLFTKGLTKHQYWFLKSKLSMVKHHAQLEGG